MKTMPVLALTIMTALNALAAPEWQGLDDSEWRSGPKLTPEMLKGKVVLVDKWAMFCPPCRAAMPHLEELWEKYRDKPFVFISSHCHGDQRDAIAKLVEQHNLTFSIYNKAGLVGEPSFNAIPFFYLVNPKGEVVYQGLGFSLKTTKELEDAVAAEIAKITAPDM